MKLFLVHGILPQPSRHSTSIEKLKEVNFNRNILKPQNGEESTGSKSSTP